MNTRSTFPSRVVHSHVALAAALVAAPITLAQPAGGPPPGWSQRVNTGAVYQADADLDPGGSFSVARAFIGADFLRPLDSETAIGFSLGAGFDAYSFDEIFPLWEDVTRVDAAFTYSRELSPEWSMRLSPSIQSSFESGASLADGIVAGLIASATHTFSEDLSLGLGIAAFTGLEETRAFPFLAIDWAISETWSVRNPFRPGPAGPAGIEVVRAGDAWEFAFGGAYRSYRFRLADDAPVPDGVGEHNGVPLFVRATRKLDQRWELDLYAGMIVGGSLELEDEDGRQAGELDFDPAPLVALTLQGRF